MYGWMDMCVYVRARVYKYVFVNKCTSQFASKQANIFVHLYTEHKVFQYKYTVLKGITSFLFMCSSFVSLKSCINKKD